MLKSHLFWTVFAKFEVSLKMDVSGFQMLSVNGLVFWQ